MNSKELKELIRDYATFNFEAGRLDKDHRRQMFRDCDETEDVIFQAIDEIYKEKGHE